MNKENIYLQSTNVDNTTHTHTHTHYTSERRKTKNNKKGLYSESFSDIQLQLHAFTVVNNPYVFNIDRNTTFKSTIKKKIELPDKNTVLYEESSAGDPIHFKVTIPEGVNVINACCYGEFFDYDDDGEAYITNQSNMKDWNNDYVVTSQEVACDSYVQVTPGKTYDIIASADAAYSGIASFIVIIYYSKTINQHKPDVVDL